MPKTNLTSIVLVVDRSGSMADIAGATEDALKEFINGQKALDGDLTIDTVFFDDQYEERAVFIDPKSEDLDLSIQPRGMTALYDAVGKKINSFGQHLASLSEDERPTHVLFVIATDGHENKSVEFNVDRIAKLIKQQQDEWNWKFTFIGANQDAVLTAKSLNIGAESAITFAATNVGATSVVQSLGAYTAATRSGKMAAYSDADRSAALEEE